MEKPLFHVKSPLGPVIHTTKSYWQRITTEKHPSMKGRLRAVKRTLEEPNEIRQSKRDPKVVLYYRKVDDKHVCAVVRHENGSGYLITAYETYRIQEGVTIWTK